MNGEPVEQQKIILFDGVCTLCNASVVFILQHEPQPVYRFASIQSKAGKELLTQCGFSDEFSEAVVLIDTGKVYLGSTAALKIGQTLRFPWSVISSIGILVPKFLRDWVYHQIGKHRYQWFGKRDVCMVPTENLKARFL